MEKGENKKSIAGLVFGIIGLIVILLAVLYIWRAHYYSEHFFPGTELNGIPVGGMTVGQAENRVAEEISDYLLNVTTREDEKYQVLGPDIDYHYVAGTEVMDLLAQQDNFAWLFQGGEGKSVRLNVSAVYDEEKLRQVVSGFGCFLEENFTKPTDAYLSETEDGYEIVMEQEGNILDEELVQAAVKKAVDAGETELELEDSMYAKPAVTANDPKLRECLDEINQYLDTTIKYDVGDQEEVLDRKTTKHWIAVSDTYEVSFDKSKVKDYVQYLATKYNTYGSVREFKTSLGDTVKIGGGDYGWTIDKEKEEEQLLSEIDTGKTIEREPAYSQRAVVKSAKYDLSDTYVEVDYTNQHMYYYKDGKLKLESDVVTGNVSRSNGSPDGIFKIIYKQSPATLVGEGYQSDVEYFMVFAYNVGFHDASWRSQFGGEIYKSSGSHGCVNMPKEKAAELYEILETNTPEVAYYREPVVLTAENAKLSNAFSYKEQ